MTYIVEIIKTSTGEVVQSMPASSERLAQRIEEALAMGPIRYGCHVDGTVIDNCVLDTGKEHECTLAKRLIVRGLCKTDCQEWRPINIHKKTIEVDPEAIADLLGELEAAKKDAERYRWLCSTLGQTELPTLIERITQNYVADYKPSIDAAIDAAIKGATP